MFSWGTGWPHFAHLCPASTVRFAASFPSMPNSFAKKPTVPPSLGVGLYRRGVGRHLKAPEPRGHPSRHTSQLDGPRTGISIFDAALRDERPRVPEDLELEDVRSRVVARGVELPARPNELIRRDVRVEDALLRLQGTRDDLAVGVRDQAEAGVDPSLHTVQVLGLEL